MHEPLDGRQVLNMDRNDDRAIGALLVANDPVIIEQISVLLGQLAAHPSISDDFQTSLRLLNTRKFEAVFVDLRLGKPRGAVLERVRLSPSNRTTVVFAICSGLEEARAAFEAGANFVIERPVNVVSAARTLKAAFSMIVRERRRYFRCPIEVPAYLQSQEASEITCQVINISEGGMALAKVPKIKPGSKVIVRFELPHQEPEFVFDSEVCWHDSHDRAGLQFISPAQEAGLRLKIWLARRLEQCLPAEVATQFRNATL
jgi:CheY-like chemotaxis protein